MKMIPKAEIMRLTRDTRGAGHRVAEHSHNYYEFVYYISAEGQLNVEGETRRIKSGRFTVMKPGTVHSERHDIDAVVLFFVFECDLPLEYSVYDDDGERSIGRLCESMANEYFSKKQYSGELLSLMLCELLLRILRMRTSKDEGRRDIAYAAQFIEKQFREKIDLSALADDSGAEQSRMIERIVVECPNPLLETGIIIGDTPGFGAAQLEGAEGSHEEALKNYLTNSVFRVFWVVLAEQGIGKTEFDFYEKYFQAACCDIIVTGSEDWNAEERSRFRERFLPKLKNPQTRFHFVSGKQGLNALKRNDQEEYRLSGIPALRDMIINANLPKNYLENIVTDILRLCEDLVYWLNQYSRKNRPPIHGWWRPDSLFRWKTALFGNPIKHLIDNELNKIK